MEKRTDLALEAHELYMQTKRIDSVPGVDINVKKTDAITITEVNISNENGAKALKKPIGKYLTIEIPELIHKKQKDYDKAIEILSNELDDILMLDKKDVVMVVGLGNDNITADALGPKVVSELLVTRHLFELMPEEIEDGVRSVCALSPGVLGLTGIETGEIVKGVNSRIKPDAIIVVDALASRKLERVATTIQVSNTGLIPGSGVGNSRMAINKETLNVPVIAIGVPTVVDAATMANDTIDLVVDTLLKESGENSDFYKMLKKIDGDEKYALIEEVLSKEYINLVVTPKEVDEIIEDISEIIANAINISMHEKVTIEDVNLYK